MRELKRCSLITEREEVASGATSLTGTPTNSTIHIGSDAPGGGDKFLGRFDELRIFDYVRSPQQICDASGAMGC